MKVLITGAAGFIGSHLSLYFLKKNVEVFAIDNYITGSEKNIHSLLSSNNFHFFHGNVCSFDYSEIPACDIIYHLASPASPIQYKKFPIETLLANSVGTHNILDFIKNKKKGTFVLASTSEIYGDPLVHPQKEDYFGNVNCIGIRSCYDEGKRYAESVTMCYRRKFDIDIRIARIFNTYGPHMEKDDGRVISNFIMQALTGNDITIYGKGNQTRSFCYVSDMVEGLYRMGTIKQIQGQVINLGNTDEKTILFTAQLIKKLIQSKSSITFSPIDADDPKKRKPDIEKAKLLLNWKTTVQFEVGLRKTISYFKERFL